MEQKINSDQSGGLIWPTIHMWSHIEKTIRLSSSARNMLDVFVSFMGKEDNLVYFNYGGMEEYLQFCWDNLQLNYTKKTIRNAISELKKVGLLLRARKDIYYVNPRYFFKLHADLDHRKLIANIQEQTGVILFEKGSKEVEIFKKREQGPAEANTR